MLHFLDQRLQYKNINQSKMIGVLLIVLYVSFPAISGHGVYLSTSTNIFRVEFYNLLQFQEECIIPMFGVPKVPLQ